jgi:hypothetical protein
MESKFKTKMYACFAFFPNGDVKRWKYVTNLESFGKFLSKDHPSWKYFNVYDKGTKQFVKRFYPGNSIPKVLGVFLLTFLLQGLNLCQKQATIQPPMKNTFSKTTFKTFINGFNYYATIATTKRSEKEVLCS